MAPKMKTKIKVAIRATAIEVSTTSGVPQSVFLRTTPEVIRAAIMPTTEVFGTFFSKVAPLKGIQRKV